jgi:hypothetical protein
MENMVKLLEGSTTDVRGMRQLGCFVLQNNVKVLSTANSCSYQWFKSRVTELEPYQETYKTEFIAFEAAMNRLNAMEPEKWTITDMSELGTRMMTEIKSTDTLFHTLALLRATVIDQKREAMKASLMAKHTAAIVTSKLAKAWIENGANKKVYLIMKSIGACCVFCYFI